MVVQRSTVAVESGSGVLRLTTRGRRVVVSMAVVLAAAIGFAGGRAEAAAGDVGEAGMQVVVVPGDTLWELAGRVMAPGIDRRDVILDIQRMNGLSSADLVAGEVLVLPER